MQPAVVLLLLLLREKRQTGQREGEGERGREGDTPHILTPASSREEGSLIFMCTTNSTTTSFSPRTRCVFPFLSPPSGLSSAPSQECFFQLRFRETIDPGCLLMFFYWQLPSVHDSLSICCTGGSLGYKKHDISVLYLLYLLRLGTHAQTEGGGENKLFVQHLVRLAPRPPPNNIRPGG